MIYIVEREGNYVAAVLEGTLALSKWLPTVPEELLKRLKIYSYRNLKYPLFILEEHDWTGKDFTVFQDRTDIDAHLAAYRKEGLCVHRVDKDFTGHPERPGGDHMGILSHEHLSGG